MSLPRWTIGAFIVGGFMLFWSIRSYLIIRRRYRLLAKEREVREKWDKARQVIDMRNTNRFFELSEKYRKRVAEIERTKVKLNRSFESGETKLSDLVNKFYKPGSTDTDTE